MMAAIFLMYGSILIGMVLSIIQLPTGLPAELGYLRPDWVAMAVSYTHLTLPTKA